MKPSLPDAWRRFDPVLADLADRTIATLEQRGELEQICPRREDIFRVFDMLTPDQVRVAIIGQDPYPNPDHAMGIAFSSRDSQIPDSLRNMYKELVTDTGLQPPLDADLTYWVEQGIMLANSALTLAHDGSTHFKLWKPFTDRWVSSLGRHKKVVWVLWGNHAKKWGPMIRETGDHPIIESFHPGPLAAYRGFYGSRPYTRINAALIEHGGRPINWARAA